MDCALHNLLPSKCTCSSFSLYISLSLSVAATIMFSARTIRAFHSNKYREKRENILPSSRRPGVFSTGAWLHGGERLRTSLQSSMS